MNGKISFVIACIVAFAGSTGTSWYLTKHTLETERAAMQNTAMEELKTTLEQERIAEKKRLQQQLDELDARIAEQEAKAAEVERRWKARETAIDDAGNLLIPEPYVKRLALPVFEDKRLSKALKTFLKLSPDQQARADKLTEGVWKRFVDEERKHATITDTANGFEIVVKGFPEVGNPLKTDLHNGLRKIVAPEVWGLLLALLNRDSFRGSPYYTFHTFGLEDYRIVLEQKERTMWETFHRPVGTSEWLSLLGKGPAPTEGLENARLAEYRPKFFKRLGEEKKLLAELKLIERKVLYTKETWQDHRRLVELYKRFGRTSRPKYPIAHFADDRTDPLFRLACVYYRLWAWSKLNDRNVKKNYDECLRTMKQLVEESPKSARFWAYKARIEYALEELGGAKGDADKSLAKAVELDPKDPDLLEIRDHMKSKN